MEKTRAAQLTAALLLLAGAAASTLAPAPLPTDTALREAQAPRVAHGGYVGSGACRSCHPQEWASWRATYHRTMTQVASPASVLAPFEGRVERGEEAFTLHAEGGRYRVCVEGEPESCWRVVQTTGSHHIQAYWVRNAEGELEQFPWVYLIGEGRWISNAASFLHPEPEGEALGAFYWSRNCVFCHTTGPSWPPVVTQPDGVMKEIDETAVVELGIACEACHGPGERHVRANRHPARRYRQRLDEESEADAIVNPARLDAARSAAVCGRCHATTAPPAPGELDGMETFRPGDRFEDHFDAEALAALRARATAAEGERPLEPTEQEVLGAFWPDGTVRVAGREHNGLSRSRCLTEGELSCTGCHSMHGAPPADLLAPDKEGDQPCRSCHAAIAADVAAHTHHAPDGAGSGCLGCHMPYTSYGLLSATRSHRIDSPTATGLGSRDRPNACNLCHLDRSVSWAAERLTAWFGQAPPTARDPELRDVPAGALWMLRGDAAQRAIAAWHAGRPEVAAAVRAPRRLGAVLAPLAEADPYAAVRHVARRSLEQLGEVPEGEEALVPPEAARRLLEARDERPTWISE